MESNIENENTSVQSVFDKVIAAQYYPSTYVEMWSSNYMCNSLRSAYNANVITSAEWKIASKAIRNYLTRNTLFDHLAEYGLPNTRADGLKIYQNWANRPQIGVTP